MASLYDHPDLYDLPDSDNKDKATLAHWKCVLEGKNIHSVLDVSIGTGGLTLPMTGLGIELYGSDLSEKMLEKCTEKARQKGININLRPSDFRCLTDAFKEKFDCVASTGNSLAYVNNEDVGRALREMDALVKDGGYLYFDLRNWDKILKEKSRFFLYNPIFKGDDRVNLIQVWDYHDDGSMTFNILYTFEKDGRIYRREEFHEHYFPVRLAYLLRRLKDMHYVNFEIRPLPAQRGEFDIDKTDWYCLIAKKAGDTEESAC